MPSPTAMKKSLKWIYSWVREWGWKQFLGKSKILAKDPEEDYYYSIPLYELCWAELVRKVLTFLCQEHFAVISLWKIQFGSKLLAVSNQLHLLYPSHKWMGKGGSVHQSLLPLLRSLEICSAILEEGKTVLCNSSTKDKEEGKKKKKRSQKQKTSSCKASGRNFQVESLFVWASQDKGNSLCPVTTKYSPRLGKI